MPHVDIYSCSNLLLCLRIGFRVRVSVGFKIITGVGWRLWLDLRLQTQKYRICLGFVDVITGLVEGSCVDEGRPNEATDNCLYTETGLMLILIQTLTSKLTLSLTTRTHDNIHGRTHTVLFFFFFFRRRVSIKKATKASSSDESAIFLYTCRREVGQQKSLVCHEKVGQLLLANFCRSSVIRLNSWMWFT